MRIGIDISQAVFGTGVSLYTTNLLRGLNKVIKKEDEVLVFGSSFRRKKELIEKIRKLVEFKDNFKNKIFSFPPFFFEIFWNKLHCLPLELFVGNLDVFHCSDWTQPPAKKTKLVTTIHDLAIFRYPQCFPKRILENQRLRIKWVKKEVKAIIAVSQATKRDIVELLKINPEKIYVIYEALPQEHQFQLKKEEIFKIKKEYGLTDYLLFVGTREPRKNLKRLIRAFLRLERLEGYKNLKLVIIGKKGWGNDCLNLKKTKNILVLEEVSARSLACFYAGAKCLVYPSLYEGFGLPVLEAMYYGCPIITSRVSSLPEISGKAALLINPLKTEEIVWAIKKIISQKNLAEELKKRGYLRIKNFSWQKTAYETLAVYKKLGES